MLSSITLYRFKNHGEITLAIPQKLIVQGGNGVGKTNLLEALYVAINASPPPGKTFFDLIHNGEGASFVRSKILDVRDLAPEYTVAFSSDTRRIQFLLQGRPISRPKYRASHGLRAVLFLPIEMNLLYLGPSLRRDFVDEVLLLAFEPFTKLKREYTQVLRSRNALLKSISEGRARASDLDAWDLLFCEKASQYFDYRIQFVAFVEEQIVFITSIVGKSYELRIVYESKVDRAAPRESIRSYSALHREKDILIGHTCI